MVKQTFAKAKFNTILQDSLPQRNPVKSSFVRLQMISTTTWIRFSGRFIPFGNFYERLMLDWEIVKQNSLSRTLIFEWYEIRWFEEIDSQKLGNRMIKKLRSKYYQIKWNRNCRSNDMKSKENLGYNRMRITNHESRITDWMNTRRTG